MATTSAWGYPDATGWIAVLGASVIFGSTGIPFKTKSLQGSSPDPIMFAFYSSWGIFLVSLPLSVFLVWNNNKFSFQPWAIWGSLDILVTTFLAFQTVQQVGYAKGPAIWATTGMIFSFAMGAVVFHETITDMMAAIWSIPCLIAGMLLIISCQLSSTATNEYSHVPTTCTTDDTILANDDDDDKSTKSDNDEDVDVDFSPTNNGDIELTTTLAHPLQGGDGNNNNATTNANNKSSKGNNNMVVGLCLGVLTGLVDGSLMVPFKMTHASNDMETYQYLASFGWSSLITTPVIFALYYYLYYVPCTKRTDKDMFLQQMNLSMIPGILNGVLWGMANVMSVTATYHLTMRIAFPLTQTCVLFATCWGIFYFDEIDKSRETLVKMVAGAGFFVVGAFLLAESSSLQ